MRKQYVEPEIIKIELNLAENIANSPGEEQTDVGGVLMRMEAGLIPKCQKLYVATDYDYMDKNNVGTIFIEGCINPGTPREVIEFRMMRR